MRSFLRGMVVLHDMWRLLVGDTCGLGGGGGGVIGEGGILLYITMLPMPLLISG